MWALFAFALALRIGAMAALGTPQAAGARDVWTLGYEATSIARSLGDGHGFGNLWMRAESPWNEASGATAWLTPVYPALLALAMKLGGGVTSATAAWIFVVQSALSAATCVLLVRLGGAIGESRAGRVAGCVLAVDPVSVWNAIHTVWDTTLVACAVTLFLWALFRYGKTASSARAAALGVLFAGVLWINPAPVAIAPVAWWVLTRPPRLSRHALARVGAFSLAALAACSPWMLRNRFAVGVFSLRSNLGVELAVGNNDHANGHYQPALHPSFNPAEFDAYRRLGEVSYARECFGRARSWIAEHPLAFALLTLKRIQIFWLGEAPWSDPRREGDVTARDDPNSWIKWMQHATVGLLSIAGAIALSRRRAEGRALACVLFLFPAAYYVTHFMERYRFPIEPVLVLVGTWAVLTAIDAWRRHLSAAHVE